MNPSLSTIDSLINQLPSHQRVYNSRINSSNLGSIGFDDINIDKTRSSPSFNDSEPPSYFEAIGISHPAHHFNINLNTDGLTQPYPADSANTSILSAQQSTQYQHHGRVVKSKHGNKENLNSVELSPPSSFNLNQNYPYHQRHHIIRTNNLPSLYQQRYQSHSSVNNSMQPTGSVNSIHKPSETYIVWSIFTTVYCVFIGVAALVLSIKVHHYNKQGEYQKAFSRSRIARNLNIAGLFFGFIYMGIGLIACLLPFR